MDDTALCVTGEFIVRPGVDETRGKPMYMVAASQVH